MKYGWKNCITFTPEETIKQGNLFSNYVEAGDIFKLSGQLASGKTTFIKGLSKGIGYTGEVTSPTFTLINEYESIPMIVHMDCYREKNLKRWINLGINEYFHDDHIILIEWPDVIEEIIPDRAITIQFSHIGEDKREIKIIK
ncbi:MAG: tRNA (adenosine(37)-N6)-threonylcarbamoyltransferase complex ATPase subunit type 1 TsaE [Fidelibacterota bacterium]